MWLIFIMACVAVVLAAMATLWLCNMLFLSMQRHTRKFKKELEKEEEAVEDEEQV